ncbi:MAG: PDZ domain-containing protein [Planctomycetota bacterium]
MLSVRNGKRSNSNGLSLVSRSGATSRYTIPKNLLDMIADEPGGQPLEVTVSGIEWGNGKAEFARSVRDVAVTLDEPVSVVVAVQGIESAGSKGKLWVNVVKANENDDVDGMMYYMGNGGRKVPSDGEVRFDGLSPGAYTVSLSVGRNAWRALPVETRDVDARDEETRVSMNAPPVHRLHVVAPALAKGTRISLSLVGDGNDRRRGSTNASVNDRGEATFEDLVAGTYMLTASGSGDRQEVAVPCGNVLFDANPFDALRVTISNIEGQFHAAGLQNGDRIVAVDGVDPGDAKQLRATLYAIPAEEAVVVTVVRDGRTFEATLPAGSGSRKSSLGGSVQDADREG